MEMVVLKAATRTREASAKALRRAGTIPAVVYGNTANTLVQCEERTLCKAFAKAGESTLVELELGSAKVPVLFHAVDHDPVTDRIIHVDFYAVDMAKEVETTVPLKFEGESPAVKELSAILVTPLTHLKIRCLPKDLPHALPVSLTSLKEIHSMITAHDVPLPPGVTALDRPETVIATVQEQRKEEEVTPAAAIPAEGEATAAEGAASAPVSSGVAPAAEAESAKKDTKKEKKEK